ncbi:MAG: copper chaperone PCu(A)C [Saccharospirillum sp.]|uniref:copper chaperone PCu(A)C n=1 Tax=Saccharospirillum sp. TaxID=2033801 RepID=UPI003298174E
MRTIQVTVALATLMFSVLTLAHDYSLGTLSIDHPWARATAPGAPVGGGFMSIRNTGDEPDRLIGAATDFATEVQIHESSMADGMMRMQHLPNGVSVPEGGHLVLRPGSYHLMFIGLQRRLVEGERETVTLEFEQAGDIEVELTIEGPGEQGPHQSGDTMEMDHGEMSH